ncbi:hypothetical protein [Pseudomonas protegens]|jgi:uncharacterized ubiquitin-like protein YukD|uniref:hypothetical protein n=1 Tax=Pseudomonas protegens TaxID=380021 RepID=UPI00069F323A|nr:hypothetical protein [Pseudomonas protegens]
MLQIITSIVISILAAIIGYASSRIVINRGKGREKIIEFSESNGKKQRLKVSSLNPSVIREAVESELKLESFVRTSLKDLVRSNGTIKVQEDDLADFVVTMGDRMVIIEAKASTDNLTDDFFTMADKKYKENYYAILVVDRLSQGSEKFQKQNMKIICRSDKQANFKKYFLDEILSVLNTH